MKFLNPIYLIGLASMAIPILIHLFGRKKLPVVEFSSLRLLKPVEQKRKRWLKLRNILLLILRTAICGFLFLALARPVAKLGFGKSIFVHPPVAVCIIVDNSPSMGVKIGGEILFEDAKKKAQELLTHLKAEDEAGVILSDGTEYPLTNNFRLLHKEIEDASLSYRIFQLKDLLSYSNAMLAKSKKPNRVIYFISDMQEINFKGITEFENIHFGEVGIPVDNIGVSRIEFQSTVLNIEEPVNFSVDVKNYSNTETKRKIVLNLDGRKVGVQEINIKPDMEGMAKFKIRLKNAGFHSGFAAIENDAFAADDIRYFTLFVPQSISVLVITDSFEESVYLEKALKPSIKIPTPFKVKVISPKGIFAVDMKKYKIVTLLNISRLTPYELKVVKNFIDKGGKVLIFLGDKSDVDFYNQQILENGFGVKVSDMVTLEGSNFLTIDRVAFEHKIFNLFKEKRLGDFSLSRFYSYFPVSIRSAKILASYSNGMPAILEGKGGILFTSSFGVSNIVKRAIFVPFMHRIFYHLTQTQKTGLNLLVDEKFNYESEETAYKISCLTPTDERIELLPRVSSGKLIVSFKTTDSPGVYNLKTEDRLLASFAVNIDPEESNLKRKKISEAKTFQESILKEAFSELTRPILWLVLILFITEVVILRFF